MRSIPLKCVLCGCKLTKDNRAQWVDHCEDCETAVFTFYGAVDSTGSLDNKEEQ